MTRQKNIPNPNGQPEFPPMLEVGQIIEMPDGVRCRVLYADDCRAYVRPTMRKEIDGEASDMNPFSISPRSHVRIVEG